MARIANPEPKTEKPGAELAKFLYNVYNQAGWSRAEAARRAKISEGYLCHLLAGDVQLPRPELFWGLVIGWNINPVDMLIAAGYERHEDIERYMRTSRVTSETKSDPEVQGIMAALTSLDPEEREMTLPVIKALLFNRRRTVANEVTRGTTKASRAREAALAGR